MKTLNAYRNRILIGVAFTLLVVIALLLLTDVSEMAAQAVAFPWVIVPVALAFRVYNWALRFIRWHYMLYLIGVRTISIRDSLALYLFGFTLALSPGKVAEFLKSVILKVMVDAPIAATAPVVAAERLTAGVAVLIMLFLSILLLGAEAFWPVALLGAAAMFGGLAVLQFRPLSVRLLDWAVRLPLIKRFAEPLRTLYESAYALFRLPNLAISVGLSLTANLLDVIGLCLIFWGLGRPWTRELFVQGMLVQAMAVFAGSVSGSPGGAGAADLSLWGTMTGVAGLTPSQASFATLLARFVSSWFGIIVGAAAGFVTAFSHRNSNRHFKKIRRKASTPASAPTA